MENLVPDNLTFSEVGHLPIIKDFAKKIKLVETLDTMVDSEMELSPGVAILAMVLDTLSGRTPLYRMEEFFQEKDTELLLGCDVKPALFCEYNIGRVAIAHDVPCLTTLSASWAAVQAIRTLQARPLDVVAADEFALVPHAPDHLGQLHRVQIKDVLTVGAVAKTLVITRQA